VIEANKQLKAQGKQEVTFERLLMGITKASLSTELLAYFFKGA